MPSALMSLPLRVAILPATAWVVLACEAEAGVDEEGWQALKPSTNAVLKPKVRYFMSKLSCKQAACKRLQAARTGLFADANNIGTDATELGFDVFVTTV